MPIRLTVLTIYNTVKKKAEDLEKNKVKWTGKAEIRIKKKLLATGQA